MTKGVDHWATYPVLSHASQCHFHFCCSDLKKIFLCCFNYHLFHISSNILSDIFLELFCLFSSLARQFFNVSLSIIKFLFSVCLFLFPSFTCTTVLCCLPRIAFCNVQHFIPLFSHMHSETTDLISHTEVRNLGYFSLLSHKHLILFPRWCIPQSSSFLENFISFIFWPSSRQPPAVELYQSST